MLKERLGGRRRLCFTDIERRRLARKAKALGREVLSELETLVTPDTLSRWYRELVAAKWTYTHRRGPGRPRVMKTITDLILRMALENPSWGYTRIRGALGNLGHEVGRGTIASILKENGIEPAPGRSKHTRWSTFLKAQMEFLKALLVTIGRKALIVWDRLQAHRSRLVRSRGVPHPKMLGTRDRYSSLCLTRIGM